MTGLGIFNSLFHITEIAYSFSLDLYLLSVTPIRVYLNSDLQKLNILKENKGKSGIYR